MKNQYALAIENVSKTFLKEDRKNGERGSRLKMLSRALLRRRVETRVVNDVTMLVPRGAIFGILGPNGSGKSTLVRMVSTLLLPDTGRILVFGKDVVREPLAVQRVINRVSVDAAFFKKLSAMENLVYSGRLYGLAAGTSAARAYAILDRLGFEREKVDTSMEHLSRGMQQKVAIARGFLTSPVLLLLDEPTTGLDPRSKRDVQAFIKELRDEHDATILLTTHDTAEAERLCDRIAVLENGKITAFDTPEGLKAMCRKDDGLPTLEDVFIELTGKRLDEEERD